MKKILLYVVLAASATFVKSCTPDLVKCAVTTPRKTFSCPYEILEESSSKSIEAEDPPLPEDKLSTRDIKHYFENDMWLVACYSKHIADRWHFDDTRLFFAQYGPSKFRYFDNGAITWNLTGKITSRDCRNYIEWKGISELNNPNGEKIARGGTSSRHYIIDVQPSVSKAALQDDTAVISYISCWNDKGLDQTSVYIIYKYQYKEEHKRKQSQNIEKAKESVKTLSCGNNLGEVVCIRNPI